MYLLFIDLETSGLDSDRHSILEVSYIVYDADNDRIVIKQNMLVKFDEITIDANALKVNRLNLIECLDKGILQKSLDEEINIILHRYNIKYLAGWNVSFDRSFLKNIPYWVKNYDVMQLAYLNPNFENHKLETIAKYFNIEHIPHKCESDVMATLEVFRRLKYDYKDRLQPL